MIRRFVVPSIACALLAGCGEHGTPANPIPGAAPLRAPAAARAGSVTLPEPPVVRSVGGVAKIALQVVENPATGQPAFQYKGMLQIPTLDVRPGDTIVVNVADDLPVVPPPDSSGVADDINLHFHGLTVSPKRPSDDVLTMLAEPGQKLHYVIHVPTTQSPGLYWYHPHVHHVTSFQVGASGMSGALIVDGLERHISGLAKMKQRLLIVRATGLETGEISPNITNTSPCTTKDGTNVTVNGAIRPVIEIAPGEKQFFRLVNATGHRTLRLKIDGEQLELVAIDGFALDEFPGTPPTRIESSIVLPPAARAEFVVTGPASGRANLRSTCYNSGPNGDPDPPAVLAKLEAPAQRPRGGYFSNASLTAVAPNPQNWYTTALPAAVTKRDVVFSEGPKHFLINGKAFRMDGPPMFIVHTGTVEEWHITNVTGEIHDFHIHQIHFYVKQINGVRVPHPIWADSVVLPHRRTVNGKTVPGSVIAIMDFRDPIIKGEFVFHCHILDHEDKGMMAKIRAI